MLPYSSRLRFVCVNIKCVSGCSAKGCWSSPPVHEMRRALVTDDDDDDDDDGKLLLFCRMEDTIQRTL